MSARADYFKTAPQAMDNLLNQEAYFRSQFTQSSAVTFTIWELVKLRVSQINQCAYCIDMHSKDALKCGENIQRIVSLNAWRDAPFYSKEEQLALHWAELIISDKAISDKEYQNVVSVFGERDIINLTIAINAINSWNRLAKVFKPVVGS